MINKDACVGSLALATIAAESDAYIAPISGSPLEELVKATNSMVGMLPMDLEATGNPKLELMNFCSNLEFVTNNSEKDSVHSQLMDSFTETISKAVGKHNSFAKNVVMPVVAGIADKVIKMVGEEISPAAEFNIEVVDLPKPMQNAGLESTIEAFDGKSFLEPTTEFRFEEVSPQEILEIMQSGSKEFDDKVNEWFASKGDQFFLDVWGNLFRDFKIAKPSKVYNFVDGVNNFEDGVDIALAVYLISRKIKEDIPENNKMELKQYKTLCFEYINASGVRLMREYRRYSSVIKNKSLIISYNPDGQGCRVNGAVYRQWLKEGGNNEIILGLIVGKRTIYSTTLIDAEKQELHKDWHDYFMFSKTSQKNKSFNRFKDVLAIAFAESFADPMAEERDFIQATPNYAQKVKQYFNEQVDCLVTKDLTDVYNTCLKIVCRSRFYYTDAEKILRGINEAVAINPSVDVREAALMSTTEYVIDYVCDQLLVMYLNKINT